MLRYTYNTQMRPPAPLVHVTVRKADLTDEVADLPAQLDTAADRTVIPLEVLERLAVPQEDLIDVMGIHGEIHSLPTFLVQLQVRTLPPLFAEEFGSDQERFALLGRDVLNRFKVVLDGPQLSLEISES